MGYGMLDSCIKNKKKGFSGNVYEYVKSVLCMGAYALNVNVEI